MQFVYPFTLEPHILAHGPAHRAQLQARQNAHVAYLFQREEEKKARKRAELNRVAPGWNPEGSTLVPDKARPIKGEDKAVVLSLDEGGRSVSEELASLDLGG